MSTQAPSNTTNAPSLSASAGTPPEAPKHGQDESQGWSAPRWPLLAALVLDLCAVGVYLMNLGSAYHPRTSGLLSTSTQLPAIVQVLLTWLVFGILWLLIMSFGVPWLKKAPPSNSMASFLKRISKFEATRWLLASYGMLAVLGILAALLLNKLTPVTFALTTVVIVVTLYAFFWRPSAPDTEEQTVSQPPPLPPPSPAPVLPTKHPLGAGGITIGRIGQPGGDSIILPHPQVSGTHARLIKEDGTYHIIDPGSTYHVYVNGQRVVDQALNPNDEIRIGPFKFIYTGAELLQYDESKGVRIDAHNLQKFGQGGAVKGRVDRVLYILRRILYTFAKGLYSILNKGGRRSRVLGTFIKQLQKVLHASDVVWLNDISFTIPAGSLVALLGGSGAGKSTLTDALNGFRRADEGVVLYNGEDYYKSQAAFRTLIGYVPQEDIVHRDLTVDRALYYAAKMRLPKDFTEQQILQRIDEVLQEVQMAEHRSKLINKLSGGQRKRVSIALELLIRPTIFFLDEPTSGLDPGLDAEVMQILWELSHKREHGHTVVLVTHSVSDISYCDYVCFLAPGGYLAYFGPRKDMLAHFEKYFREPVPIAEIYSRLEPTQQHPDAPKEAAAYFKQSAKNAQSPQMSSVPGEMKRPKPSHRRRQFWLLTRRYLELLRNDRGNLAILLLQAPVIGLLLILFVVGISTNNFAPKSTGGFDPKNVVQCPTTAAVLTPAGYPDLPTPYNPAVSRSCQQLETFLKDKPRGKAYAATKKGGAREALLEAADSAMYQDKFTRRRIYQADVEMATPQARSSVSEDQEHTAEGMVVQALMAVTTVCHRAIAAHGQRMVHLAEATARKLERPREEIHLLRLAALLHDIGKIGIPDAVLHKPAPLTKAEWSMIHRHPAIGCQILEQIGGVFGQLAPIVEAHHERWDGGGYPHGLAQEAIPVGARILAVVDSYDAMTSPRPYGQEPLTVGEARAELQRGTGSQYDPRVGEAFLRVLEQQEDTQNPLEGSKAPGPSDRANPSSDLVPTSNEGPAVEAAFAEFPARSKEHGNGHTSRAPTGHLQQQSGDSSG